MSAWKGTGWIRVTWQSKSRNSPAGRSEELGVNQPRPLAPVPSPATANSLWVSSKGNKMAGDSGEALPRFSSASPRPFRSGKGSWDVLERPGRTGTGWSKVRFGSQMPPSPKARSWPGSGVLWCGWAEPSTAAAPLENRRYRTSETSSPPARRVPRLRRV